MEVQFVAQWGVLRGGDDRRFAGVAFLALDALFASRSLRTRRAIDIYTTRKCRNHAAFSDSKIINILYDYT